MCFIVQWNSVKITDSQRNMCGITRVGDLLLWTSPLDSWPTTKDQKMIPVHAVELNRTQLQDRKKVSSSTVGCPSRLGRSSGDQPMSRRRCT